MGIDNITAVVGGGGSATAAKQDTGNTSLASIDTKVPADPAREGGNLATIAAKDFATQTTLALIKAKTDNLDVLLSTRTRPADTQPVSIASMPSTPVTGTFWQATQPVSGSFWQSTQPVSLTSLPALTTSSAVIGHVIADSGSTTAVTGNVTVVQATGTNLHMVVDSAPTTAVTGTFWQGTQPVSIASMPSTPVTGTFWQATQPISGAVSVSNFPATQPVSGTFWQATQPVSGTFWQSTQPVSIASMPSTPVTGTFWQATQPVSIATMPSTPVTGTFFQATQPVSAVTLPLPTGAAQDSSLTTLNTSVTTLDSDLAIAQGAVLTTQKGPMIQAVVSDAPQSYVDNYIQPLSVTREGRLRVSAVPGDVTEVWNSTFTDPFLQMANLWQDAGWGSANF